MNLLLILEMDFGILQQLKHSELILSEWILKNNTRLINIGAEKVIEDYTEPEKILNWINEKNAR